MTTQDQLLVVVGDDQNSIEAIQLAEVYPKKPMHCDEVGLKEPFVPIAGEGIEYLGRSSDGVIALSNYRLYAVLKESVMNIPVGVIEVVEYREVYFMHIFCKDARTFRCEFGSNEYCLEWCKRLNRSIRPHARLNDAFANWFHAYTSDARRHNPLIDGYYCLALADEPQVSVFDREAQRLCFDFKTTWRITHANSDFKVCSSYPKQHIVPTSVSDRDIELIGEFRSSSRFPSVVWRDVQSGVVLARSSQPSVGWLGWRKKEDEAMLKAIADSCVPANAGNSNNSVNGDSPAAATNGYGQMNGCVNGLTNVNGQPASDSPKKLVIIDARSYTAAVANRAKGGGCECQEYYTNCEILFMGLANIHCVRKAFLALRTICAMSPDQPLWLTNLESTKWLQYISGLLKSAIIVVNTIDKERKPVLVHCSDGWDRTPQIVALAELMLDPYYRTLEGFRVLVEKEWIEFGHKFADRCGQGVASDDVNERCPVFLQWLDCVHQLVRQFPCAFEFTETYLVKLVQHIYSCLFGDFLCNTEMERSKQRVRSSTSTVWLLLYYHNTKFVNQLYVQSTDRIIRPSHHIQDLHLWNAVYLSDAAAALADGRSASSVAMVNNDLAYTNGSEASSSSAVTSPDEQIQLPAKTRSCDDLTKMDEGDTIHPIASAQRRLSDSNLTAHVVTTTPSEDRVAAIVNCEQEESSVAVADTVQDDLSSSSRTDSDDMMRPIDTRKYASSETLKGVEEDACFDLPVSTSAADCDGIAENCGPTISSNGLAEDCVGDRCEQSNNISMTNHEAFETSSDTITGDDGHFVAAEAEHIVNGAEGSQPLPTAGAVSGGLTVELSNHSAEVDDRHLQVSGAVGNIQMTDRCLSTSDISNSHVVANGSQLPAVDGKRQQSNGGTVDPLSVDILSSTNGRQGVAVGTDADGSISQPLSCSSTSPPTPSGDLKSGVWGLRQVKPSHSLDWDGLTFYVDPIQQRIAQIVNGYVQQINSLQEQLSAERKRNLGKNNNSNNDEQLSIDSSERGSTGTASSAPSDLSWEQVEEKDSKMTLWVPDHVVSHCAGCQSAFWMARRKHHCRNCGYVFCGNCTDYRLTVPQQQIDVPARVCLRCFTKGQSSFVNGDLVDRPN